MSRCIAILRWCTGFVAFAMIARGVDCYLPNERWFVTLPVYVAICLGSVWSVIGGRYTPKRAAP